MAAKTFTGALVGGTTQLAGLPSTPLSVLAKKFNLNDLLTLVEATAAERVCEANDVFQLFNIPANTFVLMGGVIPTVADGDTLTADLGDGTNVDGFVDGVDLNSTTALSTVKEDAYGSDTARGNLYVAADTIDLKIITVGAQVAGGHKAEFVVWVILAQIPTGF